MSLRLVLVHSTIRANTMRANVSDDCSQRLMSDTTWYSSDSHDGDRYYSGVLEKHVYFCWHFVKDFHVAGLLLYASLYRK